MQDDFDKPARNSVGLMSSEPRSGRARGLRREGERRQHARFAVTATVEAVELQSKARITGRTSDLGLGGCYIDTISPLPLGAQMKMRITHEGRSFETKARVAVSSMGMGMGVAFIETEPDQLAIIEGWLRELSGEVRSEPDLPTIGAQQRSGPEPTGGQTDALDDLVTELIRTGVLADSKGRLILKKIRAANTRR
jgi:PilZ domain